MCENESDRMCENASLNWPGVSSFEAKSEGVREKEKKGKDDDAGEEVGATWLVSGPDTGAS